MSTESDPALRAIEHETLSKLYLELSQIVPDGTVSARELAARAAGIEEGRLQGLREAAGLQFPGPPCYFDGDQAYGFECGCEALLQAILARIGGAE